MEKNCEKCGVVFEADREQRRFCSKMCARHARPTGVGQIEHECEHCGKKFLRWPSQGGRFCSHRCRTQTFVGPLAGAWKGGRIVGPGGYIMIRQANRKYKFEHRIVMEDILGRPMEDHETVHHRNGIRDDNRPENLELRSGRHGKGASKHCPTCTCDG